MKLDKFERTLITLLIILLTSTVTAQIVMHRENKRLHDITYTLDDLEEQNAILQARIRELSDKIDEWNAQWNIEEFETTAYAPLDPNAIEGMCYQGDPTVTATGAKTTPGRTIAVDPNVIPLGSRVYIDGIGWRTAEDTGGAIKGNKLDVCMTSRSDALSYGRRKVTVRWRN